MLYAITLAYWQQQILKLGAVLVVIPVGGLLLGWLFLLKMMAHMQSRLGPMEPGGFHGWFQNIGDAVKFIQKEDIVPAKADKWVFSLAPYVVVLSTFLLFLVIPAGPDLVISDLGVGIFYALAVSSISVVGILMAGWASANKYALMGALRAGGQLIAYELPMVLAVLGVVIMAGSLNLQDIVQAQSTGEIFGISAIGNPFILTQFVAFAVFMIAVQAELTQTPFDMPIAESELVAGYQVEYSGIRFLVYFISEFATAVAFAAVASTLFLGGWALPASWGLSDGVMNVVGPLLVATKAVLLVGVVFWTRFSFPRFREDQLQRLAWKVLIPIALANILVTAVFKVAF